MLLEVIDGGLLVVAQIADADIPLLARAPFQREQLSEGGGADEGGGYHVMVVVAKREDLVI